MPPNRGDVLRELLVAARDGITAQRTARVEMRAMRTEMRAGFHALGAQIEAHDIESASGDGLSATAPATGPHALAVGPESAPNGLVAAPAAPAAALTPTEASRVEVRIDARGVHASASASPSWIRRHWKIVAILLLLLWGGFAAVEKGVALYHRLERGGEPPTAPSK